jgi:uncharacterized protein
MPSEFSDSVRIYHPPFRLDSLISLLKQRSQKLTEIFPLVYVVLFGSYAKKRETAASDINLLVVYEDPKNQNDYCIVWEAFDIPTLKPRVYTVSEYGILVSSFNSWLAPVLRYHSLVILDRIPPRIRREIAT